MDQPDIQSKIDDNKTDEILEYIIKILQGLWGVPKNFG